jgi:hypothetical protein
LRPVASVLRFVGAFAVSAAVIGGNLPWPRDAALGARLAHFAEDPQGYDAVVLGASGVYRGFDPAVVDAELARLGLPLRTYVLAAPGMQSFEVDNVLRAALAAGGGRLRYVFVEPSPWLGSTELENTNSYRFMFWHTPRATAAVVRTVLASDAPLLAKLQLVWTHVRVACRRAAGFGSAGEFGRAWFGFEPLPTELQDSVATGGFLSLDDEPDPVMAERHATFLAEHAPDFPGLVAALERANLRPVDANALDTNAFLPHDDQVRAIEAAGAVPVHIVPPYTTRNRAFEALVKAGRIDTLIEFTDPARWPQIYATERRHDRQHLTEEGARLLSLAFAREFARRVKAGEIAEVSRP